VLYLVGRSRIKLRGIMILGVLGLCGLIAVIPFMPHTIELQNAIMRLVGNVHKGGVVLDTSALERLNNYHLATQLFLQHPYLGIGIGGFNYSTGIIYVHNIFLEILCEFGIVGLILELTWLGILFRSGFQLSQYYPEAASDPHAGQRHPVPRQDRVHVHRRDRRFGFGPSTAQQG
jgi:O-antigen ligase